MLEGGRSSLAARSRLVMAIALAMTFNALGVATAEEPSNETVALVPNPAYGTIITDPDGWSLYTWDNDQITGESRCIDECAVDWPPYTVASAEELIPPEGLGASLGLIERDDGTWQVTLDNWPLYYFSGDVNPGDINGDGSMAFDAEWHVATVAGPALAFTPPPIAAAPPVQPPTPRASPATSQLAATPAPTGPPATATPFPAKTNVAAQSPFFSSAGRGIPPVAQVAPPPPPPAPAPPPPQANYQPIVTALVPPSGSVGLRWRPDPAAVTYRVYATIASAPQSFAQVQTIPVTPGVLVRSTVVTGLAPGTVYLLQVRAVGPTGLETVVPARLSLSIAPSTGAIPSPTNLTVGTITPTTAVLTWTPSAGATSYQVLQASTQNGPFTPATVINLSMTGATVTGLTPFTITYFEVVATDAFGNTSPPSNKVYVLTGLNIGGPVP
ncbi:MAG TPA: fibronectin type III domain-containing protein [Chloroflexota bacterium]|nr:fibronectin type III domain-containing protein [Chloroflexota bacterium]